MIEHFSVSKHDGREIDELNALQLNMSRVTFYFYRG